MLGMTQKKGRPVRSLFFKTRSNGLRVRNYCQWVTLRIENTAFTFWQLLGRLGRLSPCWEATAARSLSPHPLLASLGRVVGLRLLFTKLGQAFKNSGLSEWVRSSCKNRGVALEAKTSNGNQTLVPSFLKIQPYRETKIKINWGVLQAYSKFRRV